MKQINKIEKKLQAITNILLRMKVNDQGFIMFHNSDLRKIRKGKILNHSNRWQK